jgi:hypothetical protein
MDRTRVDRDGGVKVGQKRGNSGPEKVCEDNNYGINGPHSWD